MHYSVPSLTNLVTTSCFMCHSEQELLLILDEYWKSNPDLHEVPIYYASKMASKALRVYQTFVNMMNTHIQALMDVKNPFHFNHISNLKGTDTSMQLMAPCVVMAAPGMLQNGESRRLFEDWCDNEQNGVVLAGYSVEGTMAKRLLSDPDEITCLNGRIKKCLCSIEYVSFSAHVDYLQNSQFIHTVVPDNIVLVHGEKNEMRRLKVALEREIEQSWPDSTHVPPVVMPDNGEPVKLTFDNPIVAEVVGSAATTVLHEISSSSGAVALSAAGDNAMDTEKQKDYQIPVPDNVVMVTEHFQSKIMKTSEINLHSSCRVGQIEQQMIVPLPQDILQLRQYNHINVIHMLIPHLQEVFDQVSEEKKLDKAQTVTTTTKVCIQNAVHMEEQREGANQDCITVKWPASPTNDLIADCATGLLFQVLSTTHFLRACWLEAHKVKGSKVAQHDNTKDVSGNDITTGGSKRLKEEVGDTQPLLDASNEVTANTDTSLPLSTDEAIVKRMKLGLLDPSRAFVHSNQVDGLIYEDMDHAIVAKCRPRLEKIRSYLQNYINKDQQNSNKHCFQSVSLSQNGLRLIVRGTREDSASIDDDDYDGEEVSEAYCYIHWGEKVADTCAHSHRHGGRRGTHLHKKKNACSGHAHHATATACHAVVQSHSAWLREAISEALRRMEEQEEKL